MKKVLILLFSVLLLAACSNASSETAYPAKKEHLENIVFNGRDNNSFNSLTFENGTLTIVVDEVSNAIKPDTDPASLQGKVKTEETYTNIKVTTDGDTYFIKGDNHFSMELKRVSKRIVSDENGSEYQTGLDLD